MSGSEGGVEGPRKKKIKKLLAREDLLWLRDGTVTDNLAQSVLIGLFQSQKGATDKFVVSTE